MRHQTKVRAAQIKANGTQRWATRPEEERFANLFDMSAEAKRRRTFSRSMVLSTLDLSMRAHPEHPKDGLQLVGPPGGMVYTPTHWAFGQLAKRAGARANYLRQLPAPIAAACVTYGLRHLKQPKTVCLLVNSQGDEQIFRAAVKTQYGRIWDADVIEVLIDNFGDGVCGRFHIPSDVNSSLYSSDRDMHIFLVDEETRIDGSLARGFCVRNSEVGATALGMSRFLYDCDSGRRIGWPEPQSEEILVKHYISATQRWLIDVEPMMREYANTSAVPIEGLVRDAKARRINRQPPEFLRRHLPPAMHAVIPDFEAAHVVVAKREIETLWDVVTAMTTYASCLEFQDERVVYERMAGKMLGLAA